MTELAKIETAIPAEIEAGAVANLQRHAAAAGGPMPATPSGRCAPTWRSSRLVQRRRRNRTPRRGDTVAAFIDAMATLKAPATVRRYVCGVATFRIAPRGVANPCETQAVRAGAEADAPRTRPRPAQAAPVNDVLVARMLAAAGDTLRHRRNRRAARRGLFHPLPPLGTGRSALRGPAGGRRGLRHHHHPPQQDRPGRAWRVAPIAADAMRHLAGWIQAAGVTDGTLFRAVLKGGRVGDALDSGDVARIFKAMAQAAKLTAEEIARISGHSTRVGAAQDMVRYGVDLVGAMQAGRWKTSAMVARYPPACWPSAAAWRRSPIDGCSSDGAGAVTDSIVKSLAELGQTCDSAENQPFDLRDTDGYQTTTKAKAGLTGQKGRRTQES